MEDEFHFSGNGEIEFSLSSIGIEEGNVLMMIAGYRSPIEVDAGTLLFQSQLERRAPDPAFVAYPCIPIYLHSLI